MELEFETAAAFLRELGKHPLPGSKSLTTSKLLELYGWFKQASEGDCSCPAPSWINFERFNKHKAWISCKGMSKEEAQFRYINQARVIARGVSAEISASHPGFKYFKNLMESPNTSSI
jgi:acyl-CoA-binding protein